MLRLEALTCGYGPFCAVHTLDLDVGRGEIVALLGPNGAGKSSTIMCIAGHVTLQSGRIEIDGTDVGTMTVRDRVKHGLAVSPEGRRVFPGLTVAENLPIGGLTQPKSDLTRNQDQVLDLFPRLGERIDQPAGRLSGGEQQMLAIGRALMAKPKVLMIDELSLGLMPKIVDICYAVLQRLVADTGLAVLLVEQNTAKAVAVADRICVLESGRVAWRGDGDEARADIGKVERAVLGDYGIEHR